MTTDVFSQRAASRMSSDPFSERASQRQISAPRSIASSGIKGLVEGIQNQIGGPLSGQFGPISPELGNKLLEQALPSNQGQIESSVRRAAKLAPSIVGNKAGLVAKALSLGAGTAAGEIAQQEGVGEFGQNLAEMVGLGVPSLGKIASQGAKSLKDIIKPNQTEKLASGLTKPRAIDNKLQKYGTLTSSRKEKALKNIDEEASKLTKESIKKHVPAAQKIEEGFDFEGNFEKNFKNIEKSAAQHNPEVNITPISELISSTREKYRGIPKLHGDAIKVIGETRAFANKPQTSLKNLLKVYRSNNKKFKRIFETSKLTGSQQEYVDFLADYNRAIAKSFENTFPKDSSWVRMFKDNNIQYKNYKDAQKTISALSPITEGRSTSSDIKRLAHDPKAQKKLALSMGKEGAQEVSQIAKDIEKASSSIKNIPTKDWKPWEAISPISIFIPGIGKIFGGGALIHKVYKGSKFAIGYLLSNPQRRKIYKGALKAIINDDLPAYRKAVGDMQNSLHEDH